MDQEMSHRLHALCEEKRELRLRRATIETQEAVLDNEILKLVGNRREGSQTITNGVFRVVTKGVMNRTVLPEEYHSIIDDIPAELSPFKVETKEVYSIDLKQLRALENANPQLHKYCCRAIREKPGKINVKVEVADAG